MFTQWFRKTWFSRVVSVTAAVSFVLSSVPVSYANIDALRTPAAKKKAAQKIVGDLSEKTEPKKVDPLVLSNIISLLEGAENGGYNIENAILSGTNGGIFNHSERRRRMENAMENMLLAINGLRAQLASEEKLWKKWADTLKTELPDKQYAKEIDATRNWIKDFIIDDDVESMARRLVNYIINIQLKKLIAYSDKYTFAQNILCVGETEPQYKAKKTQEILKQDLEEILAGINKEQAHKIGLRIAYEPRWAIGTGLTPKNEEIQDTHRFIKDTLVEILDIPLDVDYGGSLKEDNCAEILALPDVDGGLIGGAAKVPEKISVVIDEAIKQGEIKGKKLNIGMNWKAENTSTGLSPLDTFVELFRTKDLSKVQIAIGTPNVKKVRDAMTELENEISAVALYSGIVVKTETIGPFTKETLAAENKATGPLYTELEKRFGEKTREGDVYFRLKLGNRYFALAKENTKDQTLMTATTLDLRDSQNKAEYYAALLEYAYLVVNRRGKGLKLIEEKGDRLRGYLLSAYASEGEVGQKTVSLGKIEVIVGKKYSEGPERSFAMYYKPKEAGLEDKPAFLIFGRETDRPISRGWSLTVYPGELKETPKVEPKVAEAPAVLPGAGPTASQLASLTDLQLPPDKSSPGMLITQKPAAELYKDVPWLANFKGPDLKGKTVVDRVDWNIPNLNSVSRIRASLPGLIYIVENGGTPIVLTHYGRPGGKVKPELSTEPLAVIARSLLAQQGYLDIQVIHHEGSITEEGVAEGLKDRIVKGAINVLENTRFCPGDEKNDPVFAKALAELAGENGIFVFDGFGAGEREHASTTGVAEHLERIALGPLVVNEERAVRGALENLYGVIFGGGPKFDEKVVMLEKVVGNIKQGGFLFIGSGPAPAFLKAHPDYENIKLGQKPSEKDITAAKKVLELAKERNIPVILPKDFVVSTKEIVDKKIPEDAKVFVVTLDKLKKGTVEISGETISPEQIFVYDVGPDSWVALDKALSSLPKESSVVWNGDLGVKEISLFASGTQTAVALLGRFSKNKEKPEGLNGVVLGADTGASIEQFVATPAEEVTYVSTGGGAALGLLEGRELTAVVKLAEIQTIKTAEKLNVGVNTYRDAKKTDRAIYDAQGQQTFSKFINAVASSRPTTEVDKKIRALIIGPNFFKIEEVISALSETAKISDVVKIALYGKNAQKMKVLLGSEDIIAGKTLSDVLAQLDSQKILQDDTVLLRSPEDRVEKKVEVRQVVASELSTLALAKAIRELLTGSPYVPSSQRRRNIGVAFSVLFSDMMEANIISKTVWAKYVSRLEDSVTKEKAFEFPADLAPTPEATKRIEARTTEAERKAREELVTAICG